MPSTIFYHESAKSAWGDPLEISSKKGHLQFQTRMSDRAYKALNAKIIALSFVTLGIYYLILKFTNKLEFNNWKGQTVTHFVNITRDSSIGKADSTGKFSLLKNGKNVNSTESVLNFVREIFNPKNKKELKQLFEKVESYKKINKDLLNIDKDKQAVIVDLLRQNKASLNFTENLVSYFKKAATGRTTIYDFMKTMKAELGDDRNIEILQTILIEIKNNNFKSSEGARVLSEFNRAYRDLKNDNNNLEWAIKNHNDNPGLTDIYLCRDILAEENCYSAKAAELYENNQASITQLIHSMQTPFTLTAEEGNSVFARKLTQDLGEAKKLDEKLNEDLVKGEWYTLRTHYSKELCVQQFGYEQRPYSSVASDPFKFICYCAEGKPGYAMLKELIKNGAPDAIAKANSIIRERAALKKRLKEEKILNAFQDLKKIKDTHKDAIEFLATIQFLLLDFIKKPDFMDDRRMNEFLQFVDHAHTFNSNNIEVHFIRNFEKHIPNFSDYKKILAEVDRLQSS